MDNAVAIALKSRSNRILSFWTDPALAGGALRGPRRQRLALARFQLFANHRSPHGCHLTIISDKKLLP